jgi:hypothetical protein
VSPEIEAAVIVARRATLEFHALLAVHGVRFEEFDLLLVKPAGLGEAREGWTAGMVGLICALARANGIPDASKLSERDRIALTHRAYDLVMSSRT